MCVFFQSEITKFEEILLDYKRYKELLFNLSPPEWQEDQRAKAMEAKVPSDRDTLEERNSEPEESACRNGKDLTFKFKFYNLNELKIGYEDTSAHLGQVLNVNVLNLQDWRASCPLQVESCLPKRPGCPQSHCKET